MPNGLRRLAWMMALLVIPVSGLRARVQEPPPPASSPAPAANTVTPAKPAQKVRHADEFLIFGTVFTEKALSLPGAGLRIRRAGEKKFRWETRANSRGEFAVRVPRGADYDVVAHAKGFADQTRTVSAKSALAQDNLVFRMQPPGGKP